MSFETAPHIFSQHPLTALNIHLVRGANAFAWSPVVRLTLDLGEYDEVFTNSINGFFEALRQHLPSLHSHHCSLGAPGGFFQRVQEGTLLGHVLEHIALELQVLGGMDVTFGKTRGTAQKGVYNVVFSYLHEEAGVFAAKAALHMVNSILMHEIIDTKPLIEHLKAIAARYAPSYSTQVLTAEARRRHIPLLRLDRERTDVFQLGTGKVQQRFADGQLVSTLAHGNAIEKQNALNLEHEITSAIHAAFPLSPEEVTSTKDSTNAKVTSKPVLANTYRILLLNGTTPCALKLAVPIVAGDGKASIQGLVQVLNRQRHTSGRLQPVIVEDETLAMLAEQGFMPESIPPNATVVRLKREGTLANGGAVIEMTDEVCAENRLFFCRISEFLLQAYSLVVAELRITAPSLRYSLERSVHSHAIMLSCSLSPNMRLYQLPTSGRGYNIAHNLLFALFPPESPKQIPILAVTAGIGGDLLVTMLSDALTDFGYSVGRGTALQRQNNRKEAGSPQQKSNGNSMNNVNSILATLANSAIDCAVLEIPLESIMRDGISYDRADVGVVLNIEDNAYAERLDNALETPRDVANAHALVAEYLHDGGVSVLNANNPLIPSSVERHDKETVYFATSRLNPQLTLHCSRGGRAVLLDAETLVLREGKQETVMVRRVQLEAALDKDLLLALTASLLAFGISVQKLRTWLEKTIERIGEH